jgi:hypothetical protein
MRGKGWYERRSYDRGTHRYVAVRHSLAARRRDERLFWKEVRHAYANTPSMSSPKAIQRRYWYTTMIRRGKDGIRDNRSRSKVVIPLSKENYDLWEKNPQLRKKIDVQGIDTPRKDIKEMKSRGLTVWIGGNPQSRAFSQKTLNNALRYFTDDELKSIKHLYIERLPNKLESTQGDVGGQTHIDTMPNRKVATMLYLSPEKCAKEEMMLVHELVHVLRKSQGRLAKVKSREEKEAELETLARVKPQTVKEMMGGKSVGYYENVPKEVSSWVAISNDRTLMTGSIEKSKKGKELTRGLSRKYDKSAIRKVKING